MIRRILILLAALVLCLPGQSASAEEGYEAGKHMELAKNRYSERFFDPRPVEQEKLDRIPPHKIRYFLF